MNARVFAHSYRMHQTGIHKKWRPRTDAQLAAAGVKDLKHAHFFPPCFLQVGTVMNRQDLNILYSFCDQLKKIIEDSIIDPTLPKEQQVKMDIEHSCWDIQKDSVRLLHLWSLHNNANNLTRAELVLPDNPAYAKFDRLIVEETKDIVIPFAPGRDIKSASALLAASRYVYLQATYVVKAQLLAEFQATLEAALVPFATRYDWLGGTTYLGVTGKSGAMTQLWLVPEETAVVAQRRLAAAPWQRLLPDAPTCTILEATPVDKYLGKKSKHWLASPRMRHGQALLAAGG